MENSRFLTEEERKEIRNAIHFKCDDDDRDPEDVIKNEYAGDEEHYLTVMAKMHNVPIGIDRVFIKIKSILEERQGEKSKFLSEEEFNLLVKKLRDLTKIE
jgi:hypothetical protein